MPCSFDVDRNPTHQFPDGAQAGERCACGGATSAPADEPGLALTLPVQVLGPRLAHLVQSHTDICHGETAPLPWRPDTPQRFHLAMTNDGMRLVLYREGFQPQAITFSDLVNAWLLANGHDTRR